jgi:hypothetical protein
VSIFFLQALLEALLLLLVVFFVTAPGREGIFLRTIFWVHPFLAMFGWAATKTAQIQKAQEFHYFMREPRSKEIFEALFHEIDSDHPGAISVKELQDSMITHFDVLFTTQQAEKVVTEAGHGCHINLEEFQQQLMQKLCIHSKHAGGMANGGVETWLVVAKAGAAYHHHKTALQHAVQRFGVHCERLPKPQRVFGASSTPTPVKFATGAANRAACLVYFFAWGFFAAAASALVAVATAGGASGTYHFNSHLAPFSPSILWRWVCGVQGRLKLPSTQLFMAYC